MENKETKSEEIFSEAIKGIGEYIGSYNGIGEKLCLDGWFTKDELIMILIALDKADLIEGKMEEKDDGLRTKT